MDLNLLQWNSSKDIEVCAQHLREEKLLIGTTDTVLGLFAPTTEEGFKGLNDVKTRFDKPYLVLVGSKDRLSHYTNDYKDLQIEKLMNAFWPGPLTIIVKAREDIPSYLTSQQKTVALRMPQHNGIQKLLAQTGDLFSTSANIAGGPLPETVDQVDPRIMQKISGIILENVSRVTPSTILDCTDPHNISIIRQGAISQKSLQEIIDL